jgi:hypothetical protein
MYVIRKDKDCLDEMNIVTLKSGDMNKVIIFVDFIAARCNYKHKMISIAGNKFKRIKIKTDQD